MSVHAHVYPCVCVCGGRALRFQAELVTAWTHISYTAFDVPKSSSRLVGGGGGWSLPVQAVRILTHQIWVLSVPNSQETQSTRTSLSLSFQGQDRTTSNMLHHSTPGDPPNTHHIKIMLNLDQGQIYPVTGIYEGTEKVELTWITPPL